MGEPGLGVRIHGMPPDRPTELVSPEGDPVPPGTDQPVVTSETKTVTTGGNPPSLISSQLRNFVVIVLTVAVVYLALVERNASAIAGLIAAWTWSTGGMFQERAAMKIPGRDT